MDTGLQRSAEARERAHEERLRARERRAGGAEERLLAARWGQALVAAVGLLAVATAIGLVVLWPHGGGHRGPSDAMGGATVGAVVTRSASVGCPGPVVQRCLAIDVRLDSGDSAHIDIGPAGTVAPVGAGTRVRVQRAGGSYTCAGVDRREPLLWLAVAFAVLVAVITRLRGVLAIAGLGISLLLVTRFLVPALLAGRPALLVSVVGALAVMFVTVLLTYGLTPPSLAACLGIGTCLLFAAVAGMVAADAAHLDGHSGELATFLAGTDRAISLQGVVLAGLVIGALGVLADMGVTQASAVMALRHANPGMSARRLFRGAFGVGRDHLIATTHTLVLAYAGATLPLLLVMRSSGVNVVDAINTQDLAEPIVATLIGAMALLLSVPLTTALCAAVVHRIPAEAVGGGHHHH
jgi:uncharacterized membrane protein